MCFFILLLYIYIVQPSPLLVHTQYNNHHKYGYCHTKTYTKIMGSINNHLLLLFFLLLGRIIIAVVGVHSGRMKRGQCSRRAATSFEAQSRDWKVGEAPIIID